MSCDFRNCCSAGEDGTSRAWRPSWNAPKRRSIGIWPSWKSPGFPGTTTPTTAATTSGRASSFPVVNLTPDELLGQAAATAVAKAAGLDAGADARPATRKIAAVSSQEVADLLADAEAVMDVLNLKLADHSRHQEMIRTSNGR